jgi:hypothetical protein
MNVDNDSDDNLDLDLRNSDDEGSSNFVTISKKKKSEDVLMELETREANLGIQKANLNNF